jgi:hypothetical protein
VARNGTGGGRPKRGGGERKAAAAGARTPGPIEKRAWKRALVGDEERIYRRGKLAEVRVKPSDAMLKTLLQIDQPHRFGPMAAALRKEIEKEVREEIAREEEARRREEAKNEPARMKQLRAEVLAMLSDYNRRMGGDG